MNALPIFMVSYLVFVFSTCCHEAAHALAARLGGDDTAYSLGHVTLDPLPHIRREPWGMVLWPIMSFAWGGYMIGWASVPYDPYWGQRFPKRWAVMSLAGPGANFVLALLAFIAIRSLSAAGIFHLEGAGGVRVGFVELPVGYDFSSVLGAVALTLTMLLQMNILLGLFNLMPVPPLDGAAVVEGLGPPPVRRLFEQVRQVPMFQFLGFILASLVFMRLVYAPAMGLVMRLLYS